MSKDSNTTTAITKKKEQGIIKHLTTAPLMTIIEGLIGGSTGVKTKQDALLMCMKAQELGIGMGNAIPHMHVVNGKPGIDIHIIKAILSKPSASISWELVKDYEPIYQVITQDGAIINSNTVPTGLTLKLVPFNKLKEATSEDNEIVGAYIVKNNKIIIVDYETIYEFTRKKKDLEGKVTTTSSIGYFSESMMRSAQLNTNSAGLESPDSAWSKYRKLMIATRAFTYGARDIASDLLMGNYETTELFDMMNINYQTEEQDGEVIIIHPNE